MHKMNYVMSVLTLFLFFAPSAVAQGGGGLPLNIVTTSLPDATEGVEYLRPNGNQVVMNAIGGTPPYVWSATGLPTGLLLDASTGVVSGTPGVGTGGTTYTASFSVNDDVGATASRNFTIDVSSELAVSTTTLPDAAINMAYSEQLSAVGGVAPYTWDAHSGSDWQLERFGLTLSDLGVIGGITSEHYLVNPSDGSSSFPRYNELPYDVSITYVVRDAVGESATKELTLTIVGGDSLHLTRVLRDHDGDPSTPGKPVDLPQVAYQNWPLGSPNDALNVSDYWNVVTGSAPVTQHLAWTALELHEGASISPDGNISGMPTQLGWVWVTLEVTYAPANSPAETTGVSFPVEVFPAFEFVTDSLEQARENIAYSAVVEASGGADLAATEVYNWNLIGPSWLTLKTNSNGKSHTSAPKTSFSGTPPPGAAEFSPYTLTLTADPVGGGGSAAGHPSASIDLVLHVMTALTLNIGDVPTARAGEPYGPLPIDISFGESPYALEASGLPQGLELISNVDSEWFVEGVPDASAASSAPYDIVIVATDSLEPEHQWAQLSFQLVVTSDLIMLTTTLPVAHFGKSYPVTDLMATGGAPPYVWSCDSLPAGMSLVASTLSGTPEEPVEGSHQSYFVEVRVRDSSAPEQSVVRRLLLNVISEGSPDAPLTVSTASLPTATEGVEFDPLTFDAKGGVAPYEWIEVIGMPPGLRVEFSEEGVPTLLGSPAYGTAAGAWNVRVVVRDSDPSGESIASAVLPLIVKPGAGGATDEGSSPSPTSLDVAIVEGAAGCSLDRSHAATLFVFLLLGLIAVSRRRLASSTAPWNVVATQE